ncbi:hypothetical protein B1A99_06560 [Cohnella sp. CIP 111063]|nr:hypothetical protein B1A99_06560 [Cohnella sp. CIP 111063]PRX73736.1 hypothetical protein B0G52_103334 [Cohnella sp. SGD-V74]
MNRYGLSLNADNQISELSGYRQMEDRIGHGRSRRKRTTNLTGWDTDKRAEKALHTAFKLWCRKAEWMGYRQKSGKGATYGIQIVVQKS